MSTGFTPATSGSAPIAMGERVQVIDVLRGFALLGILVVNMSSFKIPVFGDLNEVAGVLDEVASWLIAFGFQTKFYVLFSFLFGYGLSVQMSRADDRGAPLVPRFLRRLLGLLLIGLAHALLLYTGDILVTYALLGVVLLLMRNARDEVLLCVAASLVVLSALTFAFTGAVFATLPDGNDAVVEAQAAQAETESIVEAYGGCRSR